MTARRMRRRMSRMNLNSVEYSRTGGAWHREALVGQNAACQIGQHFSSFLHREFDIVQIIHHPFHRFRLIAQLSCRLNTNCARQGWKMEVAMLPACRSGSYLRRLSPLDRASFPHPSSLFAPPPPIAALSLCAASTIGPILHLHSIAIITSPSSKENSYRTRVHLTRRRGPPYAHSESAFAFS